MLAVTPSQKLQILPTDINQYDTTWQCQITDKTGVTTTISGSGVAASQFAVSDGGVAVCTFTNTQKEMASLTVTKTIDWSGVTPIAPYLDPSFEICISGPSYPAPAKDCKNFNATNGLVQTSPNLLPGIYDVVETHRPPVSGVDYGTSHIPAYRPQFPQEAAPRPG